MANRPSLSHQVKGAARSDGLHVSIRNVCWVSNVPRVVDRLYRRRRYECTWFVSVVVGVYVGSMRFDLLQDVFALLAFKGLFLAREVGARPSRFVRMEELA